MKIFHLSVCLISLLLFLQSCALHNGLTSNSNIHSTEVHLTKKNYKVVKKVEGFSEARYILGIGGLARKALIAEAREKMLTQSDIIGSSRAVINETVEVKQSFFPLLKKYKVFVSAYIIEFIE